MFHNIQNSHETKVLPIHPIVIADSSTPKFYLSDRMGFFVDFWDTLYYNNWLATCFTRVKYRTKIQAIPLISMIGVASCCDSQTILKWQQKMKYGQ